MKVILVAVSVLFSPLAFANPGVTKNTDIGKRDVESHYQVTRCEGEKCTINSVTKFDKKVDKKKVSFGECVFSEESNMRVSQCKTSPKKKKKVKKQPKSKIVVKEKKMQKKNRLQFHLGYGPTGLERESDNNATSVSEDMDVVVGAGYSRLLDDTVSLGISVYSNKTVTATFGIDY